MGKESSVATSKAIIFACVLTLAASGAGHAQTPKKGGVLNFAVVAEPPSTDCHAVNTFAFIHPARAHYSTLLTFKGTYADLRIAGDLAAKWEVAPDGLSYTFKLRDNVKFHDGSPLTSEDVRASYERIINPPAGVVSLRRALYQDIKSIETPDAARIIFRMKYPNASMLTHFASPWNCIYSAARLKEDPQFPAKTVLGTGAFEFVEYKKGESWKATPAEARRQRSTARRGQRCRGTNECPALNASGLFSVLCIHVTVPRRGDRDGRPEWWRPGKSVQGA